MDRSRCKVLIVDDEPDMCWALTHVLGKKGCPVKSVLAGEEALFCIRGEHFPLVFLDAKLSDMEGLDLAARIMEIDPLARIVIVSGYFYRDDREIREALEKGLILGFIDKPFDHTEIARVVEQFL